MAVQIMKKKKAASLSPTELVLQAGKAKAVKSSPKPKQKTNIKAKAKPQADLLRDLSASIEVLTTATQVHAELVKVQGTSAFHVGGLLQRIKEQKWFQAKGYDSFKAYLEGETDLAESTAHAYALLYTRLVDSGITWDQVEKLGWTKTRLIAKYLTPDNLEDWIDRAQNATHVALREYLKTLKHAEICPQNATQVAVSGIEETKKKGLPEDIYEDPETLGNTPQEDPTANNEEPQQVDDKPPPLINHTNQTKHDLKIFAVPEQEKRIREAVRVAKAILKTDDAGEAFAEVCDGYLRGLQD